MDSPKYSAFNVSTTTYKIVNGQDIDLSVLIPKTVHTGTRPIIAHFHGGFLITGHALYPDWTQQWSLSYTLLHSAILVMPNYRLFPESTGLEILSDVRDFWTWVKEELPGYLKRVGSDITPDFGKVLSYGDSAGGYLAIQSGLIRPDFVKAVVAAYPMTYIDSPWYTVASTGKNPNGAPEIPKEVFEQHVKDTPEGKIVSGAFPPERMQLTLSILQSGGFKGLGDDDRLFPGRVLEKMDWGEKVPFLFAFHGTKDRAVPCEETRKFVGRWEEKFGVGSVVGVFREGEDHGFDVETKLDDAWLQEGLVPVTKAWLS